ncbi:Conserved hypothetical protein [Clostridium acetobutylicum EA 2018]|uniref:Uncharacterized protein n=2 Tax=Clostridiaceae TaxID=31979 RepID=Q97K39_CLOAB|nr:Hypothetical protein CA_C1082 [Clostridium acetobutylicum ATCC 824]ADZ20131.1 Conserved hypothetical protein [Clostridium acetobutylicum EA 2018]AEI31606.1 hypothetical protein SMB_G1100 [Clostridium acetobutylicum DSM 1731]AWV81689.1 hypothetical protein DK921_16650 [Clostridium acetobutylicum]PSM04974.1 hypothetical protein C7T89_16645 [Clostridium sp. NJ4]
MENKYIMEKLIWTEWDFDKMKWQNCNIYAFAFDKYNYKLMIDIDYIFERISSKNEGEYYKFLVSPATLVFENVHKLEMHMDSNSDLEIHINKVYREEIKHLSIKDYVSKRVEWKWIIDTKEGKISFYSTGFNMYIRRQPILQQAQGIEFVKRGWISFYQGSLDNL